MLRFKNTSVVAYLHLAEFEAMGNNGETSIFTTHVVTYDLASHFSSHREKICPAIVNLIIKWMDLDNHAGDKVITRNGLLSQNKPTEKAEEGTYYPIYLFYHQFNCTNSVHLIIKFTPHAKFHLRVVSEPTAQHSHLSILLYK